MAKITLEDVKNNIEVEEQYRNMGIGTELLKKLTELVHEAIKDRLDGKSIVKDIYVKNKIYNVVVK